MRMQGGITSRRLPTLRDCRPHPLLAPQRGSSFSNPVHYSGHAEPRRFAAWQMINAAGCGAKSSPSGGAVVPVRGRAPLCRPGPGGPLGGEFARGRGRAAESGGGGGRGFRGAAAAAIVPGGIHQRHRRPDARKHGPGSAPVRGMAWQMPAPCGCDKGCRCRPAAAGPSSCRGELLARPRRGAGRPGGMW